MSIKKELILGYCVVGLIFVGVGIADMLTPAGVLQSLLMPCVALIYLYIRRKGKPFKDEMYRAHHQAAVMTAFFAGIVTLTIFDILEAMTSLHLSYMIAIGIMIMMVGLATLYQESI